ncbi:MAG: flavin-containing monooxygenase [Alphaproteobacteria bacterium]
MSNEHFDVIIVGAGLSGIGAAYHLQDKCPGKSYAILEARDAIGGTWDLFRYPGIRSDSDMHTLGYNFKPWTDAKAIADGPSIRAYVQETADENGITPNIRFHTRVVNASWSSADALWTVEVENAESGTRSTLTCNFLSMCSGYYSYDEGFTPEFEGVETYQGDIVHPQKWPEDLDYTGKKVVVIGSGATAMTLVPAMADKAAHVTMVQRSPTWVASRPEEDAFANTLRKVLPGKLAYAITRLKNTTRFQMVYKKTRTNPDYVRDELLKLARQELPDDYVAEHFTPTYNPWDQRLCLIPENDLFNAINAGTVSVVTETIDRFTETGLKLSSGDVLEADIIVTATGLNLLQLGGVKVDVDGAPVDFAQTWTYKGMMYSDVPNLATTFGYINASWTLRADLIAEFVCRMINHMDKTGTAQVTPRLRASDADMPERRWIEDFSPNYMKRGLHQFPKQGDREPWTNPQLYSADKKMFRSGSLEDGVLTFTKAGEAVTSDQVTPIAAE